MKKNTVIFFTWSTLWSIQRGAGAPSFQKTLELYINKGWNVYVIMEDSSNGMRELIDKDKLFVLNKKATDTLISSANWTKPFLLNKVIRYDNFAEKTAEQIIKKTKENVLLYAYEINGVKAAKNVSKKYGLPLVTRFQGTVATYYDNRLITRIKYHVTLNALKTNADLVIMTNDGTKGLETLNKLGNKSKNIKFWMNGVDVLDYVTQENNIKSELNIENMNMFLTVSRLQDWKRLDRAITVFTEVVSKKPNSILVIIGDGPEKEQLIELSKKMGVSSKVIFTGAVEHEKVYSYMEAADFFLSFYDMSNVGNPLLEAMTLGKCIITLDVGDTNKVILNEINGVSLAPDKITEIPEKIIELIDDPIKKQKYESNAKKFAIDNFTTWDERMEMEYKEVLKLINGAE